MTHESYTCDLCHREHPTKATALRCCSDKFDDDDNDDDLLALTAPDEHGCPIVTDGGSKYVRETGEGYKGIFRASAHSVEVNLSTAFDPGTTVYIIPTTDNTIQLTPTPPTADDAIAAHKVNPEGFFTLGKPSLDHLELSAGDDVRLYDHPEGFEVVPADDDPRIVTDGGWLRGTHPPHEWHQLNGIERDLLFAIRRLEARDDALSGQNIARECETLRDSPLSNGSIYPALSGLIDQGLVTKHERENTTANRYELTAEGEHLVATHVATFETLFEDTEGTA